MDISDLSYITASAILCGALFNYMTGGILRRAKAEAQAAEAAGRRYDELIPMIAEESVRRERGEAPMRTILVNQNLMDAYYREHPEKLEEHELKMYVRMMVLTDRVIDADYRVVS